jgi:hypothetical protein
MSRKSSTATKRKKRPFIVNKLVACINQRWLHVDTYNQPQSLQISGLLLACIKFVINAGRTLRHDLRSLQRNHRLVACIH